MLPYKKTSFLQGFSDDTNLAKSPEIRRFSALDFILLTANKPSQRYYLFPTKAALPLDRPDILGS